MHYLVGIHPVSLCPLMVDRSLMEVVVQIKEEIGVVVCCVAWSYSSFFSSFFFSDSCHFSENR